MAHNVTMVINYEIDKIQKVLADFNIATGITIDLLDVDFTPIVQSRIAFRGYCSQIRTSSVGESACKISDQVLLKRCSASKKTEMHFCPAGLIDVASPIIVNDKIMGYLIFGQMRGDLDFEVLQEYTEELGLNSTLMASLYKKTVFYDVEKIQCLCNIASMLISYILFMDMIKPSVDKSLQSAMNYINANLESSVSIQSISKATGISKSDLYRKFHKELGCTVSQYMNRLRVERAASMIKSTDLRMEDIAQKVGFSSVSYFSRTFKALKGVSPMKYKNSRNK